MVGIIFSNSPFALSFFKLTLISCYAFYSLVMEYADNGDVF